MNSKIHITILFLFCLLPTIKSQIQNDSVLIPERTVGHLNILPLGISVEKHMANQSTILYDFGLGLSYQYSEITEIKNSDFKLIPYLAIEKRFYTNLQLRKSKGKRIDNYSGAYGAFRIQGGLQLGFVDDPTIWYLQVGPLVGFQRAIGKSGYWNIGIGCGSTIIQDNLIFGLIGGIKLGFL